MQTELAILAFFLVIGPLIFFHELGHYLAARWNGITVEEFGIGLPPRMATLFEWDGTKFTLNWLPLGGFMKPAGEDDPTVTGGLAGSPKLSRLAVLAAGPGANLLVALLLLTVMFMVGAPEELPGAKIARVEPNSPASQAGLMVDDVILKADDLTITHFGDLTAYIYSHRGSAIQLTVQRGPDVVNVSLTPRTVVPEGQGPTGIQVQPITEIRKYGPFQSMAKAVAEFGTYLRSMVEVPVQAIRQQLPANALRPVSVVGISQLGGQFIDTSIQQNQVWPIIRFAAYISIALAITNLLPIPALDGGRILFVLVEAIRGRRIDPRRETAVHFIGFAILLAVMVVFVYLDIVDPIVMP